MVAYHHILAHFPIALLLVASLFLLLRVMSSHTVIVKLEKSVPALLVLGLIAGIAAFITGITLWPLEATIESPMAKNKILFASWALMAWIGVAAARIRAGTALWDSSMRWPVVILALIAAMLISVTGALGGYLIGSPSDFSILLKLAGWNVYQTFYSATWGALVAIVMAILIVVAGMKRS